MSRSAVFPSLMNDDGEEKKEEKGKEKSVCGSR